MKKINYLLLALLGLAMFFASCSRPMTYAERLRAEERAIEQFIAENNFTILRSFPSDTIFRPNEFFRDPATGVLFSIVSRGFLFNADGEMFEITIDDEGNRVYNFLTEGQLDTIQQGRDFFVRYRGLNNFMLDRDTIILGSNDAFDPVIMTYRGPVNRHNRHLYEREIPGLVVPLPFIGHGGRVRMIIPFHWGAAWNRNNWQAVFLDEVDFRFEQGTPWRSTE